MGTQSLEAATRRLSTSYSLDRDGFAISPEALLDPDVVAETRAHVERVLAGEYETGVAPQTNTGGPDIAAHPPYIQSMMAHVSDGVLERMARDPKLAGWVAQVTGARRLQVFMTVAMKKYPETEESVAGWHQDEFYGANIFKSGRYFNCWVALDDVDIDSGPIRFVPGSHHWNRIYKTYIHDVNDEAQRAAIEPAPGYCWTEVEAPMPAGWASIHDQGTIHGSAPCRGTRARVNMVVAYVVDDFEMVPAHFCATTIRDPDISPVVYER